MKNKRVFNFNEGLNVTISFDNSEDADWIFKLVKEAMSLKREGKQLSKLSLGILRDRVANCKGVGQS